jgi:hypothetical protein
MWEGYLPLLTGPVSASILETEPLFRSLADLARRRRVLLMCGTIGETDEAQERYFSSCVIIGAATQTLALSTDGQFFSLTGYGAQMWTGASWECTGSALPWGCAHRVTAPECSTPPWAASVCSSAMMWSMTPWWTRLSRWSPGSSSSPPTSSHRWAQPPLPVCSTPLGGPVSLLGRRSERGVPHVCAFPYAPGMETMLRRFEFLSYKWNCSFVRVDMPYPGGMGNTFCVTSAKVSVEVIPRASDPGRSSTRSSPRPRPSWSPLLGRSPTSPPSYPVRSPRRVSPATTASVARARRSSTMWEFATSSGPTALASPLPSPPRRGRMAVAVPRPRPRGSPR